MKKIELQQRADSNACARDKREMSNMGPKGQIVQLAKKGFRRNFERSLEVAVPFDVDESGLVGDHLLDATGEIDGRLVRAQRLRLQIPHLAHNLIARWHVCRQEIRRRIRVRCIGESAKSVVAQIAGRLEAQERVEMSAERLRQVAQRAVSGGARCAQQHRAS